MFTPQPQNGGAAAIYSDFMLYIVSRACLIVSGFIAALCVFDLVAFAIDFSDYRFGSEVGGILYCSPYHYAAFPVAMIGCFGISLRLKNTLAPMLVLSGQLLIVLFVVTN